jgi:RNA-directed DNA polymerase
MQESHDQGIANQIGPESCVRRREAPGEALTGECADAVSSCEIRQSGVPTPLSEAEGNTAADAHGESAADPAQSQTRDTRRHSMHGSREIPRASDGPLPSDRPEKGTRPTSGMHARGKSDRPVVLKTRSNNGEAGRKSAASAETAEGRGLAKGNARQPTTFRTLSRADVSSELAGVREAARRDRRARFTALLHHVTPELLAASFHALKREAAPGIDGLTWEEYATDLDSRLLDLHERLHCGRYRALPSRRVYIPKADGRLRPLGIASIEDKIAQHAVGTILSQIYEVDFLGLSYGFRPGRGQHDALDAVWIGLVRRKVGWVLDADIRGFFDAIDHRWLMKFVEHRIGDPRMLRLVAKWLRAGVCEDGVRKRVALGTPQGAVISPLLANVYLHYALDLWINRWRKTEASGDVIVVRYADDFVMAFQMKEDAERCLLALRERLATFGLELHPEKTRLIEFGRFAARNRAGRGERRPETFDFLGFTHTCGTTRATGSFTVWRRSSRKRQAAKLRAVKGALRRARHRPVGEQGRWLGAVVMGYMNYHAVPGNLERVDSFKNACARLWLRSLRRRGDRRRMPWIRFRRLLLRHLPRLRVQPPYPSIRFDARHPR